MQEVEKPLYLHFYIFWGINIYFKTQIKKCFSHPTIKTEVEVFTFHSPSKNEIHLLEIAEVIAHDPQVWELIFTPSIFKNALLFLFDFYDSEL